MSAESDSRRATLRTDPVLNERIAQAVAEGPYMDRAEFHREALRAHLRRLYEEGVIER